MKTNNSLSEVKGFWNGELCEYCGGSIEERRVELYRHKGIKRMLIENVPSGVCTSCGSRYYSANVLKMLDKMSKNKDAKGKNIQVPVLHFL